ncbi:hypothetical protein [Streptosporangium roseum]|uniref:hypothetical protein n=1 Tax=Streptosporangium roseum TaxID=2001 RepID=UPI001E398D8A|nr:hypothetical protein [Streptosporangium roseum]
MNLGDTGWAAWSDALLRTTGFPADGLDAFAAPEAAAAADDLLAGHGQAEVFDKALADAIAAGAGKICDIAADPLFREAVTWQNPGVLVALDGIVAAQADTGRALEVRTGPGLLRERRVFLEGWVMSAYADHLAADPRVRRWWPPALQPHLTLRERELLRPMQPPLPLSPVEAAVLARCDGRTPAVEVVADLARPEDGYLLLERLAEPRHH